MIFNTFLYLYIILTVHVSLLCMAHVLLANVFVVMLSYSLKITTIEATFTWDNV